MADTDADPEADGTADGDTDGDAGTDVETAAAGGTTARYYETETERVLAFERDGSRAAVAQNLEGYAMLKVRPELGGEDLERYYGFDMALDHAAELLGVEPTTLPVPEGAADMGM